MPYPNRIPPLSLPGYTVRRALLCDVPAVVGLLREDPVTAAREQAKDTEPDLVPYYAAFADIERDPQQFLAVIVEDATQSSSSRSGSTRPDAGDVVACAQLTLIPGLTRGGALRIQIEGVHVLNRLQGRGVGTALFAWADEMGRRSGANWAQLTSDKKRTDAHRFYERLGWVASHEGMKKKL